MSEIKGGGCALLGGGSKFSEFGLFVPRNDMSYNDFSEKIIIQRKCFVDMSKNNVLASSVNKEFDFFIPRSEISCNDFTKEITMLRECFVDICKNNVLVSRVKKVRIKRKEPEQPYRTFELDIRPGEFICFSFFKKTFQCL